MRLAPTVTPDTEFFWSGLKEHRLLIQRCAGCRALRHPPRPMCPRCNSLEWDTIESAGRGSVHSFVLPRHPDFGFADPHIVALVELDEGTRIVTNLVGVDPDHVSIGQRVAVRYETFDGDLTLPFFTPEPS
jgi:uncharacterized OB-fold protein